MSNGSSSPEATVSPRDELRWKLAAIASQHGIALVSRRDHWDMCERALRDAYVDRAREIHAAVAALRCGIVADLVAWRADGAMRVERELTQRLVERTSTDPELAQWAIDAWAFAFKIPLDGEAPDPSEYQEWRGDHRDVVIRARHLVLLGAITGMAVAATVMSGAVPRFRGASTDSAMAAPTTRRLPQAMARRGSVGNRDRTKGKDDETSRQRDAERVASAQGTSARRPDTEHPTTRPSDEVSLGDIVARMPKQAPIPVRVAKAPVPVHHKSPPPIRVAQSKTSSKKAKDLETIRGAFGILPHETAARAEDRSTKSSGAVQAGVPEAETSSCAARRPRLIRNYEPLFPSDLQDKGVSSGRVVLRFRVDEDGIPDVGTARVLESSHPSLVQSALGALEHLRYEPAPDGCDGSVTMERTIRFF